MGDALAGALNAHWEREATNWIQWTRAPGHDAYWYYSPAFFDLVPAPGCATLEVGCGEGRVARDLAARGHHVTGVDAAPTLLDAAREADPSGRYLLADAAALPLEDSSFDLVVAYNSLMDVDDLSGAVAETSRVLEPGGHLCLSVTHPVNDAGSFDNDNPDAPFVITDSYFGPRPFEAAVERDGLTMNFHGQAHALEDYTRALEGAGFLIEALREPPAPADLADAHPEDSKWTRVPMFLWIRALRPPRGTT